MKKIFIFYLSFFSLAGSLCYSQNNCLLFDGFDDNVTLKYDQNLDFDIADVFSLEVWFKTNSSLAVIYSNHKDIMPFPGHEMSIVNGRAVFEIMSDHQTDALRIETATSYNDGNWHHMAVVYNGIPVAANVSLYIDGILQNINVTTNNLSTGPATSGNEAHIGSRDNTTYFFNGNIDELRIWGRALCGEEIMARKNCQLTGNEIALLGYYNFNQGIAGGSNGSVNTLPDISPAVNTGTLTGFMLSGSSSNWVTSNSTISGTCPQASVPYTVSLTVTGKTVACKGETITLTAAGAATYTWMPNNAMGSSVVVSPVVTTIYSITGRTPGGCYGSTTYTQNISSCTGISSIDLQSQIRLYPNPGDGLLYLENLQAEAEIKVYNSLGMMRSNFKNENGKYIIDLQNEEAGIYFLLIRSAEGQILSKYIKQ